MLRVRLILWYSLLVVLTISAIGLFQYYRIERSLYEALDVSLVDDAGTTLKLVSTLPPGATPQEIRMHGETHGSSSLRELVDHALREVPDSLRGTDLADRVVSEIIDQVLTELSFQDSGGHAIDPMDAIVERSVSSRRNNLVELYAITHDASGHSHETPFFRTANLGRDTIMRATRSAGESASSDTTATYRTIPFHGERVRVARAHNDRFDVYVGYPVTDIDENLASVRESFYIGLPLALVIAIFGGLWLARKALRPIEEIALAAHEISADQLSRRIALPGRTDRELVTLTETLNSMFARLESSFQQISQFTSDASHELKTPLAIMKGEIEQAMRHTSESRGLSPEEAREVLESVMEEAERMQRIVEGLLLLSKADDRQLPLAKEEVVLANYLQSLAEDAAILAQERGLTLSCDLAEGSERTRVRIDPTWFYQVIMNLLDNALKYTPSGGHVTMFLKRTADGERVQFGVADTGMGIAAAELPKIFHRFYRTDAARSGPAGDGTRSLGLGLAIVRSIVEAHDGTITVESRESKGTRFTITMPTASAR